MPSDWNAQEIGMKRDGIGFFDHETIEDDEDERVMKRG